MTKKILIYIVAIIVLIIVGIEVWVLLSSPKPNNQNSNSYTLNVSENNKIVSGTVTANGKVTNLDSSNLSQYATISFNSTYEVMWMLCPSGYTMSSASSPSQNKINFDPAIGASMDVVTAKANTIEATCQKAQ